MTNSYPSLLSVVLDTTDARGLAEFYRELLGYTYRAGDEPPPQGEPDPAGHDWLVLQNPRGSGRIAFQQVDELKRSTWPDATVPQQLHLDLGVASDEELAVHRDRALELGATLVLDRTDDPVEALYAFADPAGHIFCMFVAAAHD